MPATEELSPEQAVLLVRGLGYEVTFSDTWGY